jgi:hypothetical protein
MYPERNSCRDFGPSMGIEALACKIDAAAVELRGPQTFVMSTRLAGQADRVTPSSPKSPCRGCCGLI